MATLFNTIECGKGSTNITIDQFMSAVMNDTYKERVTRYRQLKAQGRDDEAQSVKHSLPALLLSPDGKIGRRKTDPLTPLCYAGADYDRHDPEWAAQVHELVRPYHWIKAVHSTVSHGIRLYVCMPWLTRENYQIVLETILPAIDELIGCPHDPQTTTITRLWLTSWDPEAWCRTDEEVEAYPITPEQQAEIERRMQSLPPQLPLTDSQPEEADQPQPVITQASVMAERIKADVQEWMINYPFIPGTRHGSLLHYGYLARIQQYTPVEVNYLVSYLHKNWGDKEYTLREINRTLKWAHDNYGTKLDRPGFRDSNFPAMDDEEQLNQVIHENCPLLPEEVMQLLPRNLRRLLKVARNTRQKNYIYLALLSVLSAVTPNLKVRLDRHEYSANLAILIVGQAGSGKGIVTPIFKLLDRIEKKYDTDYRTANAAYRKKVRLWKKQRKEADETQNNSDEYPGEPPVRHTIFALAKTSCVKLIDNLAVNIHGLFLGTNEIDVIISAMNSDYGKNQGDYNCILMNESVGKDFKTDGHSVRCEFPKLSELLTGTIQQFVNYIRSTENGFFSRYLICLGGGAVTWNNLADDTNDDELYEENKKALEETSIEFLEMHSYLEAHPTVVRFTHEQNLRMDDFFKPEFESMRDGRNDDLMAVVTRGPLHVLRICGTLVGYRKYKEQLTEELMNPNEEEFELAFRTVTTLMHHSYQASTLLRHSSSFVKVSRYENNLSVLYHLGQEFTSTEMLDAFKKYAGKCKSTAYNILHEWTKQGLVKAGMGQGHYIKTERAQPQNDISKITTEDWDV